MSEGFSAQDFLRLIQYKTAKANFVDDIYDHAIEFRQKKGMPPLASSQVKQLCVKHEAIAMICEIFAHLSFKDDSGESRIRFVLEAHNTLLDSFLTDSNDQGDEGDEGETKFGDQSLPLKRLRDARFTDRQIRMAQRMSRGQRVEVNERTIGKLLATVMSFESCRKLVELLAEAGLLNREDFGQVLVDSPGHLERFYSKFLREISIQENLTLEAAE